jgi:hypothetical protein
VWTSWRGRSLDPLLAGAVAVWTLAPAIEMHSAPTPLRYYLPLAALLALGCGLLAGNVAKDKIDIRILAAAGAIAAIVTATMIMAYPHNGRSARQAVDALNTFSGTLRYDQCRGDGPMSPAEQQLNLADYTREVEAEQQQVVEALNRSQPL